MIETRIEDDIKIVTLKSGKTNPITREVLEGLQEVVREADENPSPKGIILTGSGRMFSSGFDLPIFLDFKKLDDAIEFFEFEEKVLLDLFTCRKPVVAALNGHTVAGGLIYAMAADYRIVKDHPKIKIGMSEIKIGLPLSLAQHGVMRFSFDSDLKYRDVMFSGEMMDVYKAKELGIVDEIVEEEDLLPRAKAVISAWIDTPNRPFIRMKEIWKMDAARSIKHKLETENWGEGLTCFFEKSVRDTLAFVHASMQ